MTPKEAHAKPQSRKVEVIGEFFMPMLACPNAYFSSLRLGGFA